MLAVSERVDLPLLETLLAASGCQIAGHLSRPATASPPPPATRVTVLECAGCCRGAHQDCRRGARTDRPVLEPTRLSTSNVAASPLARSEHSPVRAD
jgi:hypothetical protein